MHDAMFMLEPHILLFRRPLPAAAVGNAAVQAVGDDDGDDDEDEDANEDEDDAQDEVDDDRHGEGPADEHASDDHVMPGMQNENGMQRQVLDNTTHIGDSGGADRFVLGVAATEKEDGPAVSRRTAVRATSVNIAISAGGDDQN